MKIYGKILATTLPVVLFFLIGSLAMTYYYSYQGLSGLAEKWLDTRLTEALTEAAEQEEMLRTYGLEDIPASIAKAQIDAGARMVAIEVGQEGYIFAVNARGEIVVHPDATNIGRNVGAED